MLISLYGQNVGPERGCEGQADTRRTETPNPAITNGRFGGTLIYIRWTSVASTSILRPITSPNFHRNSTEISRIASANSCTLQSWRDPANEELSDLALMVPDAVAGLESASYGRGERCLSSGT
jgi:hypothetical protein